MTNHDVITINNRKQWENADLSGTKQNIYRSKGFDESYPKDVTFLEFEQLRQKLWAFMSSFTMTTHQIWSCNVTLATNFENVWFSPNFMLNFRISYQIWRKLGQEQKSYSQNAKLGVEPPRSAYWVKG